jgi:ankyrin repeat protein
MNDEFFDVIWRGDIPGYKRLLVAGADVNAQNADGWTPLLTAIEHQQVEIINLLIEAGADVNGPGPDRMTPLHLAVDIAIDSTHQQRRADEEVPIGVIALLLEHGANPRAADVRGHTPLGDADKRSNKVALFLRQWKRP